MRHEDRDSIRYLVNWANYSIEESTWEKAENCENAKDLIQQYHDRVLRMTTYHAMGDMADLDYMALAAITSPRSSHCPCCDPFPRKKRRMPPPRTHRAWPTW
eukprot:COSAG02_NODE_29839_length_562_cov_0.580994_2_plen_101_part_01